MPYYHACVFASFNDVSGVIERWVEKSDSLLVVEHPAEGKTQRVHCHILIETKSGEDWFRSSAKEVMGEYIKRGNYWIATRVQKGEHAGKLISRLETLVYLTRKDFPVKFSKNYSPAEIEEARSAWVDSDKNDKPADDLSNVMIRLVLKKFEHIKHRDDWVREYGPLHYGVIPHESGLTSQDDIFNVIRKETMKAYWAKNRRAPFPAQHKIVASTVLLTLMERFNMLDRGISTLLEKWY